MLIAKFFASIDALPSGRTKAQKMAIAFGLSLGCLCLIVFGLGLVLWRRHKRKQQSFFDVKGIFPIKNLYLKLTIMHLHYAIKGCNLYLYLS